MKLFAFFFALSCIPTIIFSAEVSDDWGVVLAEGEVRPATPIPESHAQAFAKKEQRRTSTRSYQEHVATLQILELQLAERHNPFQSAEKTLTVPQELEAQISELSLQPTPVSLVIKPDSPVSRKRLTPSDSTESPRAQRTYSAEQKDRALKKTLSKSERIKSWLCCSTCSPCCN